MLKVIVRDLNPRIEDVDVYDDVISAEVEGNDLVIRFADAPIVVVEDLDMSLCDIVEV